MSRCVWLISLLLLWSDCLCPSKAHLLKSNHQCIGNKKWGLREVTRSPGWSPLNGISALLKEAWGEGHGSVVLAWGEQGLVWSPEPKKQQKSSVREIFLLLCEDTATRFMKQSTLNSTKSAGILILDLPDCSTVSSKFLLSINYPVQNLLLL
jgi:hypothetical protein